MKIITIKFLQTNRSQLIVIIGLVLLSSYHNICLSQDLYDMQHSQKYAEYLSSSHQYNLAAAEYERLVFFDKSNIRFKYNLIRNYRLSGEFNTGLNRVYYYYGHLSDTMPPLIANEFMKLELLSDSLSVADSYAGRQSRLSAEYKEIFKCSSSLLRGDYRNAELVADHAVALYPSFPSELSKLTEKANNLKFKSPFAAGCFSSVIPGSGKFYTANWADGVFSMIFIAGSAWQAYRGFHEHGPGSAYGWTFASISASFYIGNIYGSVKAALRYNKLKRNAIDNQVFEFVNSDNF